MELDEVEQYFYSGDISAIIQIDPDQIRTEPIAALYKLMVLISQGKRDSAEAWRERLTDIGLSDNPLVRIVYFTVMVDYMLKLRDLDQAEEVLDQAIAYYQQLEDPHNDIQRYYGRIMRFHGVLAVYRGDFLTGTKYFNKAVELLEEHQDNNALARGYFNRAASLYWLGDLEMALQDGLKGYELIKHHKNTENYTGATNNIGLIYFSMDDPEKALKFFLMSLESSRALGNMGYVALNYHNIIRAMLLLNDKEGIREYLELFEQIDREIPLIDLLYSLSKGMALLESGRIQQMAEGQRLINKVIDGQIIDHQFNILAIFTALDYLLLEMEKFAAEHILTEINDRLTKLDEIAKVNAIKPAMIRGNLIRSRLFLIQGDIEAAQARLKYSLELADQLGQKALATIIENELQSIRENFQLWGKSGDMISISERIKSANLLKLVKDIKNNHLITKFEHNEDPLFFIILRSSGIPIYTRKFDSHLHAGKEVNEFLISGFLTAVDLFGRETFADSDVTYADKLQFQNNEIILKRVNDIVFSYAYHGTSRSTSKRFDGLVEYLTSNTSLMQRLGSIQTAQYNEIGDDLHLEIDQALEGILLPLKINIE